MTPPVVNHLRRDFCYCSTDKLKRRIIFLMLKNRQKQITYLYDYSKHTVAQFAELCYNEQNMLKCNSYDHFACDPFAFAKIYG